MAHDVGGLAIETRDGPRRGQGRGADLRDVDVDPDAELDPRIVI
jgi:hypothetical protein